MMAALRSLEPEYPIPPDAGEPDYSPGRHGRGSNVQPDWTPDPSPVPPTPEEDIPWT